jgi:RHS repeat-associated protein
MKTPKKYHIFRAFALLALAFPFLADSQAQTLLPHQETYLLSRQARVPVNSERDYSGLFDAREVAEQIQYYDGLGRPTQLVDWESSPKRRDVISYQEYDKLGRLFREGLPYSVANNLGRKQDPAARAQSLSDFFLSPNSEFSHIPALDRQVPFSETVFEASPLNRVVEQGAPGAAWQVVRDAQGNSTGQGHTRKQRFRPNTLSDSVIFFPDGLQPGFQVSSYWPAGALWVEEKEDENGHLQLSFTDKKGRSVLQKSQLDGNTFAYTYSLYAENGQDLAYVLQPQGARELVVIPHQGILSQQLLNEQAFQYRYDARHRVVEKRVPGSDWVYTVYNSLDQPVLIQDGNSRQDSAWLFTKYDAQGRSIITGQWTDGQGRSRAALQALLDTQSQLWEGSTSQNYSSQQGYTNQAFPDINSCQLFSITYYDHYDFNRNGQLEPEESFTPEPLIPVGQEVARQVAGKVTGIRQRIIGTSDWLMTTTFYDRQGRELQTVAENALGGFDRITYQPNFTGAVLKSLHFHTTSAETIQVYKAYELDHRDRVLKIRQDLHRGAAPWVPEPMILVAYEYNEWGEMVKKKLHSLNQGLSFLQELEHEYNIRGWLRRINQTAPCGSAGGGGGSSTLTTEVELGSIVLGFSTTSSGELRVGFHDEKEAEQLLLSENVTETVEGDLDREFFVPLTGDAPSISQVTIGMDELQVSSGDFRQADSLLRARASAALLNSGLNSQDQQMVVNRLGAGLLGELGDIFSESGDLFALELGYDYAESINSGATPQYNGNIAYLKWQMPSHCGPQGYAFSYDALNRVQNAWFARKSTQGWYDHDLYNTQYSYDRNGNLLSLSREGLTGSNPSQASSYGLLDDLSYSYAGNRLQQVADAGPDNLPAGVTHFIDNPVDQAIEYQYDPNGNMTVDNNKGVGLVYNHLNKPRKILAGPGREIRYFYLADGTKVKKEVEEAGNTTISHYIGSFEYVETGSATQLQHFGHEAGRVVFDAQGPQFFDLQYRLTDHLGNTRLLFREDPSTPGQPEVLQEQAYYPFGMTLAENAQTVASPPDLYQYNGKELQADFGLNWLDYGARMYDASIGRWNGVDAMGEEYKLWSSFHFSGNNPIRFVDLNGMSYTDYYNLSTGELIETIDDGIDTKVKVDEAFYFYQKCQFQEAGGDILTEEGARNFSDQISSNAEVFESENDANIFSAETGISELFFDGENLSLYDLFDDGSDLKVGEWSATSGPYINGALPDGEYVADNLRTRTKATMVKNGVGFSMNLSDKYDPELGIMRDKLRIHPDGNIPGTAGCVGLSCNASGLQQFKSKMQDYLSNHSSIKLTVSK